MDALTYNDFSEQLNTFFQIHLEQLDQPILLQLIEADDRGDSLQERFSLLFKGPMEPILPQGTYQMHHPALQDSLLFVVPVGRTADGIQYEALIHRFKQNLQSASQ